MRKLAGRKDSPPPDHRISDDRIDRACLSLGFAVEEPITTKNKAVVVAFLFAIETAVRAGEIYGLTAAIVVGKVLDLLAGLTKNGRKRDVALALHRKRDLTHTDRPGGHRQSEARWLASGLVERQQIGHIGAGLALGQFG